MRKRIFTATALLLPLCLLCACTKTSEVSVTSESETSVSSVSEEVPDGIKEAIESETASVDTTPTGEVEKGAERASETKMDIWEEHTWQS